MNIIHGYEIRLCTFDDIEARPRDMKPDFFWTLYGGGEQSDAA